MPCTTVLVGKEASIDGSTMIARNCDYMTAFNPYRLVVVKPESQPKIYTSVKKRCEIKLPDNPLRYTAMPCVDEKNQGIWGEASINSANVAMSATETSTTNSRILGLDPLTEKGIGEEDIVTIVAPYIHSAREGVRRLGALLEKYGTYESNGIAFSDKDEVWYMESIGGHHWAAKRVPDDSYVVAPNWFMITQFDFDSADTMASADLKQLIDDNHLNMDRHGYNLRHIFGSHDDSDYAYNVPRQWYVQKLFNPSDDIKNDDPNLPFSKVPEELISVEDVKYALSSHYQRTPYDRYGHGTEEQKNTFRPIGLQRNQEIHILQLRNDVPAEIAGLMWVAYGPNEYNAVAPLYANVTDMPAPYKDSTMDYDINSMYWLTHTLATIGDEHFKRYSAALETMKQQTMASGRHLIHQTDAAVQKENAATGAELRKKLEKTNDQVAAMAHAKAMKALGSMVKTGALKIKMNF